MEASLVEEQFVSACFAKGGALVWTLVESDLFEALSVQYMDPQFSSHSLSADLSLLTQAVHTFSDTVEKPFFNFLEDIFLRVLRGLTQIFLLQLNII